VAGILDKKTINLVPEDIRERWKAKRVRTVAVAVAIVYLIGVVAVYAGTRASVSGMQTTIDTLAAEKAALAARSAEYRELTIRLAETRKAEADYRRRLDTAMKLTEGIVSWSAVLKRLSNDIPGGVWLRTLSTADAGPVGAAPGGSGGQPAAAPRGGSKKVRFLGTAVANGAIADFIFTLENSGYFTGVDLSYTQKREVLSSTVYDFEVEGTIKPTSEIMYEW